jgi:hypothetical protein
VRASILAHRFAPRENRVIEQGSLTNPHDCRRWRALNLDTVLLSDWCATSPTSLETLTAAADILTPLGHLIWIIPAAAVRAAAASSQSNPLQTMSQCLEAARLKVVLTSTLKKGLWGPAEVVIAVGRKPAAAQQRSAA